MPVDWEKFKKEIKIEIEEAGNKTDERLASKISSITRMTDDEIMALFPNPGDVQKLTELMEIVQSAEDRNLQINKIVDDAEKFGGIVLTLLQRFA